MVVPAGPLVVAAEDLHQPRAGDLAVAGHEALQVTGHHAVTHRVVGRPLHLAAPVVGASPVERSLGGPPPAALAGEALDARGPHVAQMPGVREVDPPDAVGVGPHRGATVADALRHPLLAADLDPPGLVRVGDPVHRPAPFEPVFLHQGAHDQDCLARRGGLQPHQLGELAPEDRAPLRVAFPRGPVVGDRHLVIVDQVGHVAGDEALVVDLGRDVAQRLLGQRHRPAVEEPVPAAGFVCRRRDDGDHGAVDHVVVLVVRHEAVPGLGRLLADEDRGAAEARWGQDEEERQRQCRARPRDPHPARRLPPTSV